MAQLQVIDRQVHPSVQAAAGFAQRQADRFDKKEQLKIQRIVAATNAKNAETDRDKLKLQRVVQAYDMMEKLGENLTPEVIKTIAETVGGEATMTAIQQLGQGIKSRGLDPEKRLKAAQAGILERELGGQGGGSAPSSDAAGRGRLLESMNIGGMTFSDPQAKAQIADAETRARESAKLDVQRAPVAQALQGYRAQLARATQQMGGLGQTALSARVKGLTKKFESEIGNLEEVQAFSRMREGMGLTLASFINRGRPTEPDAAAARKLLPDVTYPEETNKALNRFVDNVLGTGGDVGPGNEYTKAFGRLLVDKALAFVEEAKKSGASEQEISQVLQEYYQQMGL